jgi:hypothetical protein
MLFVLSGTLIGAMLGGRFTVFALIPAMTCTLIIAGASAVTGGGAFGVMIIQLALFLTCLQIGYLGGAALRFSLYGSITRGRMERSSPNGRSRQSIRVDRRRRLPNNKAAQPSSRHSLQLRTGPLVF